MHSPRAACQSSAADSAVVRTGARTAVAAAISGAARPKAAAPTRNPASRSSPLGVRPGPLPSNHATATCASWPPPAAMASASSRLSILAAPSSSPARNAASATAATAPRAGRAGAHSLTARTTTGPPGPVQLTAPSPTRNRPSANEDVASEDDASEVRGSSALVVGISSPHGSRTASWVEHGQHAGRPGGPQVRAPRKYTPSHSAGRAGPARTGRRVLLAAAMHLTSRHPVAEDDFRHALGSVPSRYDRHRCARSVVKPRPVRYTRPQSTAEALAALAAPAWKRRCSPAASPWCR